MQERYLGDSHDFIKYAVLKALHGAFNGPLGLNWYLTLPDAVDHPAKTDGEMRHHLTQPVWNACDPDLVTALAHYADPARRSITGFEHSGVLPGDTRFVSEPVPADRQARAEWHEAAFERLAPCPVVFLDPDNGFEIRSMSRRTSPKYALHSEADAYRARGQVVVSIQFAHRKAPELQVAELTARRAEKFPEDRVFPVLRARTTPNVFLHIGAPAPQHGQLRRALDLLVSKLPGKLEWIGGD